MAFRAFDQLIAQPQQSLMPRQRQRKTDLRQIRQLVQQHTHQPGFRTVTQWIFHRQQAKTLDQLPGQGRHFQHPATAVRPFTIFPAHIEAAHLGPHRGHDLVFKVRRNPDPPLRRRKETALGGVHTENTADGIGKLHPVVAMRRCPRTGIEAFRPRDTADAAMRSGPEWSVRGKVVR